MQDKDMDIVVFGATGFTGQLIAEYLHGQYGTGDLRIAIAGRNLAKLETVQRDLCPMAEIIVADATDEEALTTLAKRARVVISAAGPYTRLGGPLVDACADWGADYVDLCGESNFSRDSILNRADRAKQSGARIVHSCGVDSMPSDLGVQWLQELAVEKRGAPFSKVRCRVEAFVGAVSGGTLASMATVAAVAESDPGVAAELCNPFAFAPGFQGPPQPPGDAPVFDDDLGTWAGPFVMAEINTKVVHYTNFLRQHAYGTDFTYDEMVVTGTGQEGRALAEGLCSPGALLDDDGPPPTPGEGPSKQQREAGHFTMAFHGGDGDERCTVRVSGFKDPGYGATSQMIAEAALCLLSSQSDRVGGVWSPAACMGSSLRERLQSTGVLAFQAPPN
ncbi:MAG: saccharopine dehydrogenase NADP-binding domain-containing protein [Myxococcota bacterium]